MTSLFLIEDHNTFKILKSEDVICVDEKLLTAGSQIAYFNENEVRYAKFIMKTGNGINETDLKNKMVALTKEHLLNESESSNKENVEIKSKVIDKKARKRKISPKGKNTEMTLLKGKKTGMTLSKGKKTGMNLSKGKKTGTALKSKKSKIVTSSEDEDTSEGTDGNSEEIEVEANTLPNQDEANQRETETRPEKEKISETETRPEEEKISETETPPEQEKISEAETYLEQDTIQAGGENNSIVNHDQQDVNGANRRDEDVSSRPKESSQSSDDLGEEDDSGFRETDPVKAVRKGMVELNKTGVFCKKGYYSSANRQKTAPKMASRLLAGVFDPDYLLFCTVSGELGRNSKKKILHKKNVLMLNSRGLAAIVNYAYEHRRNKESNGKYISSKDEIERAIVIKLSTSRNNSKGQQRIKELRRWKI